MKTVAQAMQEAVSDKKELIDRIHEEIELLTRTVEEMGDLAQDLLAEKISLSLSVWGDKEVAISLSGEIQPGTRSRLLAASGKDEVTAQAVAWDRKRYRQVFGKLDDLPVTATVWSAAPDCHKALVRHIEELEWCGDLPDEYEIVEELEV